MRHFLLDVAFSRPPSPLSGGMLVCAQRACLIAHRGTAQGVVPAHRRAAARTVDLAPITATADVHLRVAARAHVQSVRFDTLRHTAHPGKHWTTPCREGIKARRPCPCGTRRKEGPGFCQGLSGPSLFGQPGQHSAAAAPVSPGAQLTPQQNTHATPAMPFVIAPSTTSSRTHRMPCSRRG